MHLLPLLLGRLADHADRETAKYALGAVFLRLNNDNTFEAVATDTKTLVRVTGPCVAPPGDYPIFAELAEAPDDGTTALIPVFIWRQAFTWARKLTARMEVTNPACRSVAVRIGPQETTFGVSDGEHPWWERATNSTGRYVPYQDVITKALAEPLNTQFAVDPTRMAQLLTTAADFCQGSSTPRVEIDSRGLNKPVVVRSTHAGMEFLGLIMPLTPEPEPWISPDVNRMTLAEENASLRAERDELVREVARLKPKQMTELEKMSEALRLRAERDDLVQEVARLKAALSAARSTASSGQ